MPAITCLSGPCTRRLAGGVIKFATRAAAASALALLLLGAQADAAEIRLLSAAAMQSVFKETVADFERGSGHGLIITYDTIGGVEKRLRNGEAYDAVVGSSLIMPSLTQQGRIDSRSLLEVCRTAIGGVVAIGTPPPSFASIDAFKRALLDARFIVYADPARGGAAGVHIARQIEKLGIAEQLQSKTRVAAGGDITEVTLALGDGALGMTQVSEIVQKKGAHFVGLLPGELQNFTVFVAGAPAQPSEAVAEFTSFLQSPRVRDVIRAKGMQPGPDSAARD